MEDKYFLESTAGKYDNKYNIIETYDIEKENEVKFFQKYQIESPTRTIRRQGVERAKSPSHRPRSSAKTGLSPDGQSVGFDLYQYMCY